MSLSVLSGPKFFPLLHVHCTTIGVHGSQCMDKRLIYIATIIKHSDNLNSDQTIYSIERPLTVTRDFDEDHVEAMCDYQEATSIIFKSR